MVTVTCNGSNDIEIWDDSISELLFTFPVNSEESGAYTFWYRNGEWGYAAGNVDAPEEVPITYTDENAYTDFMIGFCFTFIMCFHSVGVRWVRKIIVGENETSFE